MKHQKFKKKEHPHRSYPEYAVWCSMRSRCHNPTHHSYADYGGRGISVSSEWDSFEQFLADMGSRPSKSHSIERIDNSLGYCKLNCCWATKVEQANNRRNTIFIEYNGQRKSLSGWAKHLRISYPTLKKRIIHEGLTPEDAFNRPVKWGGHRPALLIGTRTKRTV